jgi:transposase
MAGLPDRGIRSPLERMLRMDQVHVVRHKVLVEGRSQRAVARELGLARVTVRKYLDQAAPTRVEATSRPRPVWDAVAGRVQALFAESAQWTGGKQRLTATRLHALVVAEGHRVGVTVVRAAVAEWKRQRREVFVPLTYRPGDLAEVDFFEVLVDVDGVRRKAWLFLMRLMYSGRDFAWIYERQDQISFLDGHVRAFAHFDGVPARVAYDNLRAAVVRILVGGARTLTPRFSALASHYLLEACFCRPGEGHDKGGVEARGKAIRQQALVPIPTGSTLATINATLLARMDARVETTRDAVGQTIGVRFAEEQRLFRSVPTPFTPEAMTLATVTPRALVRLEGAYYSVPTRWAGLDLVVRTGATTVTIVGRRARGFSIRACGLGSGRSTTGITCRSSRVSRRPYVRSCRISCGISARRFRRSGISSTRRTGPEMRRGSSPKCSASSIPTGPASSCRRCTPRSSPRRRCCWR